MNELIALGFPNLLHHIIRARAFGQLVQVDYSGKAINQLINLFQSM
jgi:hypothetical protein